MDTQQRVKPVRRRKKKLQREILEQMEFYFSNSNLTRDKYLREYLSHKQCVPISVFLTFNKIKCLTDRVEDLVGAIKKSHFLHLNENDTVVTRRVAFTPKEDTESCTIYVEGIPFHSTAEIISRTFSAYGTVDYVSLPRNRNTSLLHGFGFVEFRTPNMAYNALQAFGSQGRRIPSEHYPECPALEEEGNIRTTSDIVLTEQDCIPGSALSDSPAPTKRRRSTDSGSKDAPVLKVTRFTRGACSPVAVNPADANAASSTGSSHSVQDSSTATSGVDVSSSSCVSSTTGRQSSSVINADSATTVTETVCNSASCGVGALSDSKDSWNPLTAAEDSHSSSSSSSSTSSSATSRRNAAGGGIADEVKSGRASSSNTQHRRKTRRGRKKWPSFSEVDIDLLNLKIMPLSEWLLYRERYRSLQREHFSEVKKSTALSSSTLSHTVKRGATQAVSKYDFVRDSVVCLTQGENEKQSMSNRHNALKRTIAAYKNIPGVVYVDMNAEGAVTHLRFACSSSASAALSLDALRGRNPLLLSGAAEKQYWSRIEADRNVSRSFRRRTKKLRGKDRILRRLWNLTTNPNDVPMNKSNFV